MLKPTPTHTCTYNIVQSILLLDRNTAYHVKQYIPLYTIKILEITFLNTISAFSLTHTNSQHMSSNKDCSKHLTYDIWQHFVLTPSFAFLLAATHHRLLLELKHRWNSYATPRSIAHQWITKSFYLTLKPDVITISHSQIRSKIRGPNLKSNQICSVEDLKSLKFLQISPNFPLLS